MFGLVFQDMRVMVADDEDGGLMSVSRKLYEKKSQSKSKTGVGFMK